MIIVKVKGDGVVPPTGFIRYWLWSLFGNEQDGPSGDAGWNPKREDTAWVRLKWWCRNPLHNFTFYTLGLVNRDLVCNCWPSLNVFNPSGGWLFMLTYLDKRGAKLPRPFVSYIGPIKFYIGWRLGNRFGVKLTANSGK